MKTRPTIFISGVSHEFGSFRDVVEKEIEMKGCLTIAATTAATGNSPTPSRRFSDKRCDERSRREAQGAASRGETGKRVKSSMSE
jgi:hypothetical protein